MYKFEPPYLLFLGDAQEPEAIKTAAGIAHWRPGSVAGQYRLDECGVTLGLPNLSPSDAASRGAKTLVVGLAMAGGSIPDAWRAAILDALRAGLDVAAGLHTRLASIPEIAELANKLGRRLIDVRHTDQIFPVGTGEPRSGRRLLTVGTDCAVGKKYTALALCDELKKLGVDAEFRATGQTGIMISGGGIPMDSVISDFLSGAAEQLTPDNHADHWDIVEGQGSLLHPAYAAVTLGLLHGTQPDALIMCHKPGRQTMIGFDFPAPDIRQCIDQYLTAGSLTNPDCRFIGVSMNTQGLSADLAAQEISKMRELTGLPCADPIRTGLSEIAEQLL